MSSIFLGSTAGRTNGFLNVAGAIVFPRSMVQNVCLGTIVRYGAPQYQPCVPWNLRYLLVPIKLQTHAARRSSGSSHCCVSSIWRSTHEPRRSRVVAERRHVMSTVQQDAGLGVETVVDRRSDPSIPADLPQTCTGRVQSHDPETASCRFHGVADIRDRLFRHCLKRPLVSKTGAHGLRHFSSRAFGDVGMYLLRGRIDRAAREVEADPSNAKIQAEYMRIFFSEGRKTVLPHTWLCYVSRYLLSQLLNKRDPRDCVAYFERQNIAINDAVVKEYITALAATGQLRDADLQHLSRLASSPSLLNGPTPAGLDPRFGEPSNHRRQGAGAVAPQFVQQPIILHPYASSTPIFPPAGSGSIQFQLSNTATDPLKVVVVERGGRTFMRLLGPLLSTAMLIFVLSLMVEDVAGSVEGAFGGSSRQKLTEHDTKTRFADVKGCDEVKEEVQEVVEYLRDPTRFTRLGAKMPKGLLLSGPPGTGKTMIARAIAGEAEVPFIHASGSEFEEMFVGLGARRIRELFKNARKTAPCIVFIDEIDAIGGARKNVENKYFKQTLNQLLTELDGFEENEGVVLICATNSASSLDSALIRPGRLDKIVDVPLPDLKGRIDIIEHYARNLALSDDVDTDILAKRTSGMTGADLSNLLNIAAVRAAASGARNVSMQLLDEAFDRVKVGLERRNPMPEDERRLTAYHEGGHALVGILTEGAEKLHKATIMPRGSTLGTTWYAPEKEKFSVKLKELVAQLDVMMGGKAAEELIFGPENVSAGCRSDLQQATLLARQMVMEFGMGIEGSRVPMYIDAREYGSLSENARMKVDLAVQKLLDDAYNRAFCLLQGQKDRLHLLANALVEHETLSSEDIMQVIESKPLTRANRKSEKIASRSSDEMQKIVNESDCHIQVDPMTEKKSKPRRKKTGADIGLPLPVADIDSTPSSFVDPGQRHEGVAHDVHPNQSVNSASSHASPLPLTTPIGDSCATAVSLSEKVLLDDQKTTITASAHSANANFGSNKSSHCMGSIMVGEGFTQQADHLSSTVSSGPA